MFDMIASSDPAVGDLGFLIELGNDNGKPHTSRRVALSNACVEC